MRSARRKAKKTKEIKISKKGVAKIFSVLFIAAVLAWFFVFTHLIPNNSTEESSYAAPQKPVLSAPTTVEAENFSTYSYSGGLQIIDDLGASGGKGMMFSIDTTSEGSVSIPNPTSKLIVTAKSNRCHGGPTLIVKVGGMEVMNKKIPADAWNDYSTNVNLPAGSHSVSVSFMNDFSSTSGQGCDRALFVDKLSFQ